MPADPQIRQQRETSACRQCGDPHAPEPGTTGLCGLCRDEVYPPISERGGKWSPLALGGLSLVCDVLLIPSIMAIVRGFRDLRVVAAREREGYWAGEHPGVRSGAVWGIVLGAIRPMVAVMLLLTMFIGLATFQNDRPAPVRGPSELDEVLARIDDDDEATRSLAMEHLVEMGPSLSGFHAERLLARAERALDVPAGDERRVRGRMVASALGAEMGAPPPADAPRAPQLAALYPRLDAEGRTAVLSYLAGSGSSAALARLGELAATDDEVDHAPRLPVDPLSLFGGHADRFLPRLLTSAAHRADAASLAAGFCRADTGAGLASSRAGLMAIWTEAADRPLPGEGWRRLSSHAQAREAADALTAIGCLEGPDVDALLEEATAHEDPRLAVAAVEGLLRRGGTVSPRILARLAADPLSRSAVIDVTTTFGGVTRIPIRWRRLYPVAESDVVPWLVERGLPVTAVRPAEPEGLRSAGPSAVLDVEYGDGSRERLIVGSYPASAWARRADRIRVETLEIDRRPPGPSPVDARIPGREPSGGAR